MILWLSEHPETVDLNGFQQAIANSPESISCEQQNSVDFHNAVNVVRDQEAVGSNPIAPTILF